MFLHNLPEEDAEFLKIITVALAYFENNYDFSLLILLSLQNNILFISLPVVYLKKMLVLCRQRLLSLAVLIKMGFKDVVPGDCVSIVVEGRGLISENVTQIERVIFHHKYLNIFVQVKRKGIYAPLTSTGDIFANGMLASCHSNLGVKTLQQTFFSTYKGVSSFFKKYLPTDTLNYGHDLPNGVSYLTSVLDLFVPHSYF